MQLQGRGDDKAKLVRVTQRQADPLAPGLHRREIAKVDTPMDMVPVLSEPVRKLKREEAMQYRVPMVLSAWENRDGHTVGVAARVAADGRRLIKHELSTGHADMAEALAAAQTLVAREISERAGLRQEEERRRQSAAEDRLREMAKSARQVRSVRPEAEDEGAVKREAVRDERRRAIKRDVRVERATGRRSDTTRALERDVGERMALGQTGTADGSSSKGGDADFDPRLFARAANTMGKAGDDSLYDKPLFSHNRARDLYRP
ncbi:SKI-interacting protein, SKIP, partial [Kipferlia bialata]|eukprot:g10136.t1